MKKYRGEMKTKQWRKKRKGNGEMAERKYQWKSRKAGAIMAACEENQAIESQKMRKRSVKESGISEMASMKSENNL